MLKNLLVSLTGFESDARALEAAFLIGWPFNACVDALHIRPEAMEIVVAAAVGQVTSKMGNIELIHALQREAATKAEQAKASFDAFSKRDLSGHAFGLATAGITASFRELEGNPVQDLIAAARFSDLVVLGRAPVGSQFSRDAVANILVCCGRPVVLVPNTELSSIGRTIAIAWKEKAESARAVTAAMPLLSRAKKVVVLTAAEANADAANCARSAEHLAQQLARHGIATEARTIAATERSVEQRLVEAARESGADLLVAGAYSHSRVRELVFGGFTREVLIACGLPVFLLH